MSIFQAVRAALLSVAMFGTNGCALNLNLFSGQLTLQPSLGHVPTLEGMQAGCLKQRGHTQAELRLVMNEATTTANITGHYQPC